VPAFAFDEVPDKNVCGGCAAQYRRRFGMTDGRSGQGPGGSSGAETNGPLPADEAAEPAGGTGDAEIPIGVPVSEEEFRRMKEAAQRPTESDEETELSEQKYVDDG